MKLRKYLNIIVTTHEGREYENPLMLSEVQLISKMAQENKSLTVEAVEISEEEFKFMFG